MEAPNFTRILNEPSASAGRHEHRLCYGLRSGLLYNCNVSKPETAHGRMEASEFRYRKPLICSLLSFEAAACGKPLWPVANSGKSDCLIAISQSGETADTLEAPILASVSELWLKPATSRLSRWPSIIRPACSKDALHSCWDP